MDFITGISPLTFKAIMEHNALITENMDDFVYDIKCCYKDGSPLHDISVSDITLVVMSTLLVSSNWADERRELSKIGNRPTV